MTAPLVTVVTPSFNQGAWIAEAIDSVLAQDYPHVEYLVMDGGSTDRTLEVLRGYGDRVVWQSGPDGGQARALHTAFGRARGEILAWLNSDDVYLPGAISAAVAALERRPRAAMVYGNAEFIDVHGRVLGRAVHVGPSAGGVLLKLGDCIVQPAAFFRRDAYEAVGGLDPELHWTMDYDLWLRFARARQLHHIDATLARVRLMPTTKTASGAWKRLHEIETVARRHGGAGLPAWFALEAAAMSSYDALGALRQLRVRDASSAMARAVRSVATRGTLAALALPLTWRMLGRRLRSPV
jgi:glycosyltransferase involved in cell wall biosynthesis